MARHHRDFTGVRYVSVDWFVYINMSRLLFRVTRRVTHADRVLNMPELVYTILSELCILDMVSFGQVAFRYVAPVRRVLYARILRVLGHYFRKCNEACIFYSRIETTLICLLSSFLWC